MKEKTETFNQGKRYFFYILMFAILGWFIFMQIFGANERSSDTSAASVIYSGTVTWQKPDGTTQEISVPGTYKVPVGDTMVLTIQLPDDLTDTCFAIRSSLRDVDFYVGDNLRTSYSTHKTRLVGKNSASRYVFCPVYASDAGKELRIELTTYHLHLQLHRSCQSCLLRKQGRYLDIYFQQIRTGNLHCFFYPVCRNRHDPVQFRSRIGLSYTI